MVVLVSDTDSCGYAYTRSYLLGLTSATILHHHTIESGTLLPGMSNLATTLNEGRSVNTRKTYYHSFNQWRDWAVAHGCTPLPANELSFSVYLGHLISTGSSFPKIHGIFYAVKHHHVLSTAKDPCESFIVKRLYEAARRNCRKGFNRKRPVTIEDISKIHEFFQSNSSLTSLRSWTMVLLMFSGFFRYDEVSQIRLGHITVTAEYLEIYLPQSKGDIYRDGDVVVIAAVGGALCPLSTLRRYLVEANIIDDTAYIFRALRKTKRGYSLVTKNSPLAYNTVRTMILTIARSSGVDCTNLGTHSLRAGGASISANNGTNDRIFKRHGRWKSDKAKDGYVKDSLENRLSVTRNLGL